MKTALTLCAALTIGATLPATASDPLALKECDRGEKGH